MEMACAGIAGMIERVKEKKKEGQNANTHLSLLVFAP
jgi:hypothetical protein